MRLLVGSALLMSFVGSVLGGGNPLQKDIDIVVKQGRGTPEGRAAWERLSNASAAALPAILDGLNTKDTVAANWLRTVFERIVEREEKAGKKIDMTKTLAFAKNPANEGRARRFALDFVEARQPGTRDALAPGWLDDPEFRFEAVAFVLAKAKDADKRGEPKVAHGFYSLAFDKSRDMLQLREAALGLEARGAKVSVGTQMGFLMDWRLIGPFDGKGQLGHLLTYAPEKKVDLNEELDGQEGKVRWKRFQVKETPATSKDRHQALVNLTLKDALGNADDAVAFAYTEFTIDKALKAEMRGAADDHLIVYVNGAKVFGFVEWRNGVRHDRHRFAVDLKAGKNTVLVKIAQSAAPNPEPNWEFMLRVVDATGKGIQMKR